MMTEIAPAIFVPSRQRIDKLTATIDSMLGTGLPVFVFVEPQELDEYSEALPSEVNLTSLEDNDRGIGYARQQMLELAELWELETVLINDDDIRVPENYSDLAFAVQKYGLPGCGAYFRVHSHFLDITPHTGVHANTGGMGVRSFALHVPSALEAGGFDEGLVSNYEDYDLIARLITSGIARKPWGIHSGVHVHHHGSRYQPGGISSVDGDTEMNELMCAELLARKHPEYVSVTSKGKARVQWKKMYQRAGFDWPLRIGHERQAQTASFEVT